MIKQAKISKVTIFIDQKQDIVQDQRIQMNIIKDNSANQKTDKHNEPTINKNDITQESNKAPQKHDIIGIKQHIINTNDYKKKRIILK